MASKSKKKPVAPVAKSDLPSIHTLDTMGQVGRLTSYKPTVDGVMLFRATKTILTVKDDMERAAAIMRHLKALNPEARKRLLTILSDVFENPLATAGVGDGNELPLEEGQS